MAIWLTIFAGMEALIAVDVQNDFCSGGALAVPDGDAVVEPINRMARESSYVVATRDWHPPDHDSFAAQGGPWPVHCVRDTPGAQFNPAFDADLVDAIVDAGREPDHEGYSGFEHTDLEQLLRDHDVDTVHVAGLGARLLRQGDRARRQACRLRRHRAPRRHAAGRGQVRRR